MFIFNCIILFVEEICASNKSFYFLIAVHVILIIAILLYALNTNMCSIYKNSFSFFCLFLMPPSTQRHSRKLIFYQNQFFATRSKLQRRWQPCRFQSFVINDHQKTFWSYSSSAEDSILNISLFSIQHIYTSFPTFNRVSMMMLTWENWKFI